MLEMVHTFTAMTYVILPIKVDVPHELLDTKRTQRILFAGACAKENWKRVITE